MTEQTELDISVEEVTHAVAEITKMDVVIAGLHQKYDKVIFEVDTADGMKAAKERAEADSKAREKREAEERAKREELEKQRKEQEKKQAEQKDRATQAKAEADAKKAEFPGTPAILDALCEHFDVTETVIKKWLKVLK